jgi:hypothetical protein
LFLQNWKRKQVTTKSQLEEHTFFTLNALQ